MRKIKLLTDSACDIPPEKEAASNIRILSFPLTVDGKGYLERIDVTTDEFYHMIENANEIPTTAQITQLRFEEAYNEIFDEGYTDIICVTINSKGSATFAAANMARDTWLAEHPGADKTIHVVDSRNYTITYGYPLLEADKKITAGASLDEVLAYLDDWFSSVKIYYAPFTLKFAKKSGRISATAAFVGEMIGLRPIMRSMDNEMVIADKVRGDKALAPRLIDFAMKEMVPQTPYMLVQGMDDEPAEALAKELTKRLGYPPEGSFKIGAAVASNAGPHLLGVVIKGENRGNSR